MVEITVNIDSYAVFSFAEEISMHLIQNPGLVCTGFGMRKQPDGLYKLYPTYQKTLLGYLNDTAAEFGAH